ncbi:hypothetical protein [Paraburkholderia sp. B3]|uniref:hypothetical protein n=1 Tax=Paraburkholderia sp. B3 TaxID=3134791 RepID=UPI00398220AC
MFFRFGRLRFPPASRVEGDGRAFGRVELDLVRDRHARSAMEAYADACEADMPWLAEALRQSPFGRSERLTQCPATVLRVFVLAQSRAAVQPDYAHAAWEHVRKQLTALLSARPEAENEAEQDAPPPGHPADIAACEDERQG